MYINQSKIFEVKLGIYDFFKYLSYIYLYINNDEYIICI